MWKGRIGAWKGKGSTWGTVIVLVIFVGHFVFDIAIAIAIYEWWTQ